MKKIPKLANPMFFFARAFLFFSATPLLSISPIEDWNSATEYQVGALVLVGQSSYIATKTVPASVSPPNPSYWTDLSVAANSLNIPIEGVPNLTTDVILNSIPQSSPETQDDQFSNSSESLDDWINTVEYGTGSLVLFGQKTYIATQTVPANLSPPNMIYWIELNAAELENPSKVFAPDAEIDGSFGFSVSLDSRMLAVGAYSSGLEDAADQGAVYLFRIEDNGSTVFVDKIEAPDGLSGDRFGISVSLSNKYLAIGAHTAGDEAGAAYLYKVNSTGPAILLSKLTADDGMNGDWYGRSVSISDDLLAVGARRADPNGIYDAGAAYLYRIDSLGNVLFLEKITAIDKAVGDYFGRSVSISENLLAVGAYRGDSMENNDTGAVYLYRIESQGPSVFLSKITSPDGMAGDFFGISVSLSENYLAVGAENVDFRPIDAEIVENAGAAYLFRKQENGNFTYIHKVHAPSPSVGDDFGKFLYQSANLLAVGARYVDYRDLNNSGATYLYRIEGNGTVSLLREIVSPDPTADDRFGTSVAISNSRLVVGASGNDPNGQIDAGAAYIYNFANQLPSYQPLSDTNFNNAISLWFSDQASALSTYGHIMDWNVSEVTDMSNAFAGNDAFNEDLSAWDVSSVTKMNSMFDGLNSLSFANKAKIHQSFSINPIWPYDWSEYANLVEVNSDISIDTTWKASSTYLLSDVVFVNGGATLTIEPGTIIYADLADENTAPALIVAQGSKIHAEGTKDHPIVFTSALDLDYSLSNEDKGLWGGLIILGKAPINSNKSSNLDNQPLTDKIEGVPEYSSLTGRSIPSEYLTFGGSDPIDDSGILKYVSIRHGGAKGVGWELKGLSMAGVGSQSKVEHVEVFATKDDGIDFLGGVVSAKYLSVAYSGDDSFDIDQGYAGVLQFLLSIQDENSNSAIEVDGSTESDDLKADTSLLPDWSQPTIANVTAIGNGKDRNSSNSYGNLGLKFRDNAGGKIWNSIFTEFSDGIITVENTIGSVAYSSNYSEYSTPTSKGTHNLITGNYGSQALLEMGALGLKGNLFFNSGSENTAEGLTSGIPDVTNIIFDENNGNTYDLDPKLINLTGTDPMVSPFPDLSSPAYLGSTKLDFDPYFLAYNYIPLDFKLESPEYVSFQGAFAAGRNWTEGWTKIDQIGKIGSPPKFGDFEVIDSDIIADTTWKSSKVYLLSDLIFVTSGATLTIEPGTLVKAVQGAGDDSPSIIVTQGSKIHAAGTRDNPIVFTSILDQGDNLSKDDKGLWGGIVVLGKAPINSNGDGEDNYPLTDFFDSIPLVSPNSGRILPANGSKFGGNDPSDTSGVIEYVSIRHAGLGVADAFSLAGVGNGTTINHVEIYAAKRDGLEIHGGSFNAKKLAVAYVGDDSIDIDQGFNGHLQFLLSIQDVNSDCFIDSDGSNELEDRAAVTSSLPDWSEPIIANFTAIGPVNYEKSKRIKFRDNAGGIIFNSIFTEFGQYIMEIEKTSTLDSYGFTEPVGVPRGTMNSASGNAGSQALLEMGILGFKGNLFYKESIENLNVDAPMNSLITIRGGDFEDVQMVDDIIFDSANYNAYDLNPQLLDINESDGVLYPFPETNSPALSGAVSLPGNSFLVQTPYRGAFADAGDNWLANWTKTDEFIVDARTADDDNDGLSNYEEINVYDTDPKKSDTDLDGIDDKQEIEVGMNPLQSDRDMIDKISRALGMSDSSGPYTSDWFFLPNASGSWIYSTQELYPYFYDSKTKSWLFFKSNETGPRFYHYNARTWMNLNELAEKW